MQQSKKFWELVHRIETRRNLHNNDKEVLEVRKRELNLQKLELLFVETESALRFLYRLEVNDSFGVRAALQEILNREITIMVMDNAELDKKIIEVARDGTILLSCKANVADIAIVLGLT